MLQPSIRWVMEQTTEKEKWEEHGRKIPLSACYVAITSPGPTKGDFNCPCPGARLRRRSAARRIRALRRTPAPEARTEELPGGKPGQRGGVARYINHSCDPNCEASIDDERIFIHALRDIEPGEELCFDYGFDIDCYEEHPCLCGKDNCVGYIVSQDQWPELKKRLAKKNAKKP